MNLSQASGLGTYTTTRDLPATWQSTDGAYLSLGDVLDTAKVTVNGTEITVNQSDRGRIDLGKTLRPGTNTIAVRVATTLFNAVRKTGDGNYQIARLAAHRPHRPGGHHALPRHRPADVDLRRRRRHRPGDALAHARRAGVVRGVHAGRRSHLRREHDGDRHLHGGRRDAVG